MQLGTLHEDVLRSMKIVSTAICIGIPLTEVAMIR